MGYLFELGAGQCVYLENLGDQTHVTTSSSSPGQQQQSSNTFQTGTWILPPAAFRVAIGCVIKLQTAHGEQFLHVQGGRISALLDAPSLTAAQRMPVQVAAHVPEAPLPSMPPMQAMAPMQPMTLGEMQMGQDGMSMQMGNMRLSMTPIARLPDNLQTNPASVSQPDASGVDSGRRRFCSQCGVMLQPSDRFCASCGHRLD